MRLVISPTFVVLNLLKIILQRQKNNQQTQNQQFKTTIQLSTQIKFQVNLHNTLTELKFYLFESKSINHQQPKYTKNQSTIKIHEKSWKSIIQNLITTPTLKTTTNALLWSCQRRPHPAE
jgi:hypothetical protein